VIRLSVREHERLLISFQYDGQTTCILECPSERMRTAGKRWIDHGLNELVGAECLPRLTLRSSPEFLPRLAEYLRSQFQFQVDLQFQVDPDLVSVPKSIAYESRYAGMPRHVLEQRCARLEQIICDLDRSIDGLIGRLTFEGDARAYPLSKSFLSNIRARYAILGNDEAAPIDDTSPTKLEPKHVPEPK
jgi:hypothetical protein